MKGLEKEYHQFGSVAAQELKVAGQKMKDVGDGISSAGQSLTRNVTTPLIAVGTAAVGVTATVV